MFYHVNDYTEYAKYSNTYKYKLNLLSPKTVKSTDFWVFVMVLVPTVWWVGEHSRSVTLTQFDGWKG